MKYFDKSILDKFDFINQKNVIGDINKISTEMSLSFQPITNLSSINSLIRDELSQSLFREFFKDLSSNSSNVEALDLRPLTSMSSNYHGLLINAIKDIKGKNLLVNARLASDLSDTSAFSVLGLQDKVKPSLVAVPYLIGKLYDKDIWVDPFGFWDEDYMISFDSVDIEIIGEQEKIHNNSPRIEVSLEYKFFISNPTMLYIFTDDYQKNSYIIVRNKRNDRIDQILLSK